MFHNIKIKLNLRACITLKPSVLIFQALEPLQPHWPHWPLQPLYSLKSLISLKNFLVLIVGLSLALKWLILFPFCWMNHQKSKFSLISYTLSVRGCWGQPILLFWKQRKYIKNLLSQNSKTTFKQDFTYTFQSVRANS